MGQVPDLPGMLPRVNWIVFLVEQPGRILAAQPPRFCKQKLSGIRLSTRLFGYVTLSECASCSSPHSSAPSHLPPTIPTPFRATTSFTTMNSSPARRFPNCALHYTTLGTPLRDAAGTVRNAVIVMHGTGGAGTSFLSPTFAGILFCPACLLDATKYFVVLPEGVGRSKTSKPSDGLRAEDSRITATRISSPQTQTGDRRARYQAHAPRHGDLDGRHAHLDVGLHVSGPHGRAHPARPRRSRISGRNRMMRRIMVEAIRQDPDFNNGNYEKPLTQWARTSPMFVKICKARQRPGAGANPRSQRPRSASGRSKRPRNPIPTTAVGASRRDGLQSRAASRDQSPALCSDWADDQVNPPELGILEREIKRVKRGQYFLIPTSDKTRGHGTHSLPAGWGIIWRTC